MFRRKRKQMPNDPVPEATQAKPEAAETAPEAAPQPAKPPKKGFLRQWFGDLAAKLRLLAVTTLTITVLTVVAWALLRFWPDAYTALEWWILGAEFFAWVAVAIFTPFTAYLWARWLRGSQKAAIAHYQAAREAAAEGKRIPSLVSGHNLSEGEVLQYEQRPHPIVLLPWYLLFMTALCGVAVLAAHTGEWIICIFLLLVTMSAGVLRTYAWHNTRLLVTTANVIVVRTFIAVKKQVITQNGFVMAIAQTQWHSTLLARLRFVWVPYGSIKIIMPTGEATVKCVADVRDVVSLFVGEPSLARPPATDETLHIFHGGDGTDNPDNVAMKFLDEDEKPLSDPFSDFDKPTPPTKKEGVVVTGSVTPPGRNPHDFEETMRLSPEDFENARNSPFN